MRAVIAHPVGAPNARHDAKRSSAKNSKSIRPRHGRRTRQPKTRSPHELTPSHSQTPQDLTRLRVGGACYVEWEVEDSKLYRPLRVDLCLRKGLS